MPSTGEPFFNEHTRGLMEFDEDFENGLIKLSIKSSDQE
jgi:hypothetical protein